MQNFFFFSVLFTVVFMLQVLYKDIEEGSKYCRKETKVYTNGAANDDK